MMVNLPAYYVEYVGWYLGWGVNHYERKYFRSEEEQRAFVKELEGRNHTYIKTGVIEDFYHSEVV